MRILWHIHGYPPRFNAGGEWAVHNLNKLLRKHGHSISVLVPDMNIFEYEGIRIIPEYSKPAYEFYKNSDLIITHLVKTGKVINLCRDYDKPLLYYSHNTSVPTSISHRPNIGVIWNTEWIQNHYNWKNPSIVVHPPTIKSNYKVDKTGNRITLINLWEPKGGAIFTDIARALPQFGFLGVRGGYGEQIVEPGIKNIKYLDNSPDMKAVYKQTKIVLMPSTYESWGMVATEAMVNGIPVIASPTPGLQENLGYAGIYKDRKDKEGWVNEVTRLMTDEDYYKERSELCFKRVEELNPEKEVEDLNLFINKFVKEWKPI
jgi:glycosyltransferase involved in cell wall biosynthesis